MLDLSVFVCPCLSETVYSFLYVVALLDMSCPDLRMKSASSLSWGGSPCVFFLTQNTCLSEFQKKSSDFADTIRI